MRDLMDTALCMQQQSAVHHAMPRRGHTVLQTQMVDPTRQPLELQRFAALQVFRHRRAKRRGHGGQLRHHDRPEPNYASVGSPLNTVTWYFQIVAAEIRVIDCDSDLDLTPVQRVARMLNKGYLVRQPLSAA